MIVVAGEALVDLIPDSAGHLAIHPGGGPFNTARWLGRLGAEVAFLGAIAADPLGQRLRAQLVEAGVALDLVVATERPTTLALAQLDGSGVARYSFYTSDTSISQVWPEQVEQLLPADLDALYLGSIGLMLEPAATAATHAVRLARRRGAWIVLDPNIRPTLIPDRAVYLARLDGVLAQTDVLKLSLEDLDWLAPGEPPLAAARRYLDHGPTAVLLTMGAEGATVLTAADAVPVPPAPANLVDTIGAGDAFSAGFLARLLASAGAADHLWGRNASPRRISPPEVSHAAAREADLTSAAIVEAAEFAVRVAAVACSVRGATPPADIGQRLPPAG